MKKRYLFLLFMALVLELGFRAFFCHKWDIPFFRMDKMVLHYYPELRDFEKRYAEDTASIKLLVLGGSAVNTNYSNLNKFIPLAIQNQLGHPLSISIYNLAQYGQTTMDSRTKMNYLKHFHFDYTLFYHAINDTRANNIPDSLFDINYRHFDYYNEVYIAELHPEKIITVIPFTLHYMEAVFRQTYMPQPHVPPYYMVKDDSIYNTTYWAYGEKIKTAKSFRRNLNMIYNITQRHKNSDLLLFTYANYTPANYSLENFMNKKLDYKEQKWPTELYGDPPNVIKGIAVHNNISRSFKGKPRVRFIDYALMVPHTGKYFNDICHPTEDACKLMSAQIARIIISDSTKRSKSD